MPLARVALVAFASVGLIGCGSRVNAGEAADARVEANVDALVDDTDWVLDTGADPARADTSPASFSEVCGAAAVSCPSSSRDLIVDVTKFGSELRIVRVDRNHILTDPPALVLYGHSSVVPTALPIADGGRAIDLHGGFALTCDGTECRAHQLVFGGEPRLVRIPGTLPARTRAVASAEPDQALFAGEGVRRWDGAKWIPEIAAGQFNAIQLQDGSTRDYVAVGDNGLVVVRRGGSVQTVKSGTTASLRAVAWWSEGLAVLTESGDVLFGDIGAGLAPCPFGGVKAASLHKPWRHHARLLGTTTDGRMFAVTDDAQICLEDAVPDARAAYAWSCGISSDQRLTVTSTQLLGTARCVYD